MIGNDIIDLAFARKSSSWQRKAWLNKLFTVEEQQQIWQSNDPENTLWIFWSMKESAYKIIVREEQRRFFAPKKLHCTLSESQTHFSSGTVRFQSKTYLTKSACKNASIHTVAIAKKHNKAIAFHQEILAKSNSEQNRYWHYEKIIASLCSEAKFLAATPRIKKNDLGIPYVFIGATQQSPILSISHHGRFAAFVYTEC